jgi:hypothetical protein
LFSLLKMISGIAKFVLRMIIVGDFLFRFKMKPLYMKGMQRGKINYGPRKILENWSIKICKAMKLVK